MGEWKIANILEIANRRAERVKFETQGVAYILGTLDLVAFKVISGLSVYMGFFWKWDF